MRADLRRDADEIWVIDATPEGHQPPVNSRIFQGVQQSICIVIAARNTDDGTLDPAIVRFRRLPAKNREVKFAALAAFEIDDKEWEVCPNLPREPFLPAAQGLWEMAVRIEDMFLDDASGVMAGRTWVIAPDQKSLARRWDALKEISDEAQQAEAFFPHPRGDRTIDKESSRGLTGHEYRSQSVRVDRGRVISPTPYGAFSFDRQWVIPDNRLFNSPNPGLWKNHSNDQIYITAFNTISPESGPALTITDLIPDISHYKGSSGGRVFSLWSNQEASRPNIRPALLAEIASSLNAQVTPSDLMAYISAVAANPAYTARFQSDLIQPGLRIPLTKKKSTFGKAVEIGRRVIWLHTYGRKFVDPESNRPKAPPRAADGPTIPRDGAIPTAPAKFPNELRYDEAALRLYVGEGFIDNVTPEVRAYEISNKNVIEHWFSYRRKDRRRPVIGNSRPRSPLESIQPDRWQAGYTEDLFNLLHILTLLTEMESEQADLLKQVCSGPLINATALRAEGVFDDDPAMGHVGDDRQSELNFKDPTHP